MSESANNKFTCACDATHLSACKNQPLFKRHEGKEYCVLHYPGTDKIAVFRVALRKKIDEQDFDFRGIWFPEAADFIGRTFSATTDFTDATFAAAASFNSARFSASAYFNGATFSQVADFTHATFSGPAYFYGVNFNKTVSLEKPRLDFQFAQIEKPERASFHTLALRPHWFINVDSRKFEFIDVDWNYPLKEEIKSACENYINAPHRLLAITFRQLADNAEANHRYHEASRFRYNAFEARRIEKYHGFVPWRLDWWYWLASG